MISGRRAAPKYAPYDKPPPRGKQAPSDLYRGRGTRTAGRLRGDRVELWKTGRKIVIVEKPGKTDARPSAGPVSPTFPTITETASVSHNPTRLLLGDCSAFYGEANGRSSSRCLSGIESYRRRSIRPRSPDRPRTTDPQAIRWMRGAQVLGDRSRRQRVN